jgi:heme exporter protein C
MMKKLAAQILGPTALVTTALTVYLGIWVTPQDDVQGNLARMLYIHPAAAWIALYVGFGTAIIASLMYLWPRTRSTAADHVAASAMEVTLVYTILTLITGSLWGRPAWGVWWVWDARLTSTAVLAVLVAGYLALRRAIDDPELRARRSAVLALVAAINVPVVHFAVVWWKTLHQGATILTPGSGILVHGIMAWTMLLSFIAFTLVYAWMVRERYRIAIRQQTRDDRELAHAVSARHSEGGAA